MVDVVLGLLGFGHEPVSRKSVVDALRGREALAEEEAEAALNGMRLVRLEYDPRYNDGRQARLDSIHTRLAEQRARIAELKEELAHG